MDKKTTQILSSFLAIVLCVAFLWIGKHYIWNNAVPGIPKPDDGLSSELTPDPGTGSDTQTTDLTAGTDASQSSTLTSSDQAAQSSDQQSSTTTLSESASDTFQSSTTSSASTSGTESRSSTSTAATSATQQPFRPSAGYTAAPEGYFKDALFIGDSRMVGIASYAPFDGANYFATVGLATYKIGNAKSEVDQKGTGFNSLLSSKTYGKVYIMLGINEIGNDRTATMKKYADLVNTIKTAQPNAIIYLCANLHVTAKRSAKGDSINNQNINSFNAAVKNLCDNSTVYYLDINPQFDDESGCLRSDYTNDGVHPLAKYYKLWAEWFKQNVIVR
ncbi:MAG: lipase [Oscillospiraceae bacterium]|nr:lipase [Oscillospiraceae bacterium]